VSCIAAGRAEMFYPPGHVEGKKYPLLLYSCVIFDAHFNDNLPHVSRCLYHLSTVIGFMLRNGVLMRNRQTFMWCWARPVSDCYVSCYNPSQFTALAQQITATWPCDLGYVSWSQKTTVSGLPAEENRIILCLLVLTHYQRVTDRQTDTPPAYVVL